jgi:uncharacterized protein YecE (DUF72 family)
LDAKPAGTSVDPITANWTYIRWLGDRKQIEALTMTWDKAVVDRTAELSSWVDFCYQMVKRGVLIYAYANNHFQGHRPATIEQSQTLWHEEGRKRSLLYVLCRRDAAARGAAILPAGLPEIEKPHRMRREPSLFD